MKVISHAISKTLLYHCKNFEKPRVLLLGPIGLSAANKAETTLHSGLAVKPGPTLLRLNDKSKAAVIFTLSEVRLLIIDDLFMVKSDLWTDIDWRLEEVFMMIPKKAFVCLSVMTVADFLQLPTGRRKFIFSEFSDKDSMKHLLGLQLWHFFNTRTNWVARQNDKLFIALLNRVQVGNIDDNVQKFLKARFIHESDKNYPKDLFYMYAENKSAMKMNEAVLSDLPGEIYRRKANDKIPHNCKYPLATIPALQNQKQTNARGLAKLLKIKIGAKVMLTVNLDIHDCLINGHTGKIKHIEFVQGSVWKVYIKFSDEQVNLKAMRSSYLGKQNASVTIEKCVKLNFR